MTSIAKLMTPMNKLKKWKQMMMIKRTNKMMTDAKCQIKA